MGHWRAGKGRRGLWDGAEDASGAEAGRRGRWSELGETVGNGRALDGVCGETGPWERAFKAADAAGHHRGDQDASEVGNVRDVLAHDRIGDMREGHWLSHQ